MSNNQQKRLVMSEPSRKKKRRMLIQQDGDEDDTSTQKRRSLCGRELLKLRLQQKRFQQKQFQDKITITPQHHLVERGEIQNNYPDDDLHDPIDSTLPFIIDTDGQDIILDQNETGILSSPPFPSKIGFYESTPKTGLTKTPMPAGDEKWMSPVPVIKELRPQHQGKNKKPKMLKRGKKNRKLSDTPRSKQQLPIFDMKEDDKKMVEEFSKYNCQKKTKQYVLDCQNLPRGTTPGGLALFLAGHGVEPQIRMAKAKRAGRSVTRKPKHAILICDFKAQMEKLRTLDGITMPSVQDGDPDSVLQIVLKPTNAESKSNRSLHISNINRDASKEELHDLLTSNNIRPCKICHFQNEGHAIVFLRTAGDVQRAQQIVNKTLRGSELMFEYFKGQIDYNKKSKSARQIKSPETNI